MFVCDEWNDLPFAELFASHYCYKQAVQIILLLLSTIEIMIHGYTDGHKRKQL